MMAQVACLILLTQGIPPEEMAGIVAERLARLDKLVVELTAELHVCPASASPLDRAHWTAPTEPGDGGRRRVTIVRPYVLEESDAPDGAWVTSFGPNGAVRRWGPGRDGRMRYWVCENSLAAGTYTGVPVLQLCDVQVQESFIAGLNTLGLLRDHGAQLVRAEGEVSTYGASIVATAFVPPQIEQYEFDLNARGTPLRFKLTASALDRSGFVFERELFTLATAEVNGAELVTEAVAATWSWPSEHRAIHHIVVTSFRVDETLRPEDVRIEPEQRNSRIWITHGDLTEETRVYDEQGKLMPEYAQAWSPRWRSAIAPVAGVCALLAAGAVAFVSRRRR